VGTDVQHIVYEEISVNKIKKVCVIGLGYIGLPTAALLANRAYHIHGVDLDQRAVNIINRGEIHIVEPELDTFVKSAVNSGKLKADIKPAEADVFIIAVPTPFHEGFVPNVDYVSAATLSIVPYLRPGISLYWNLHPLLAPLIWSRNYSLTMVSIFQVYI